MAIAAGEEYTVALKNDGSVVAWGGNDYGQTNVPIQAQSGVTAIAAGRRHTVALKNDGSVVSWGNLTNVQLGAQSGVTAIAAGDFTMVLFGGGLVMPEYLQVVPDGVVLLLKWPTSAVGFTLQSTADLTVWTDWSGLPAVIGSQFIVTNSIAGPGQFYRLKRP
jgi:hypothetical protein